MTTTIRARVHRRFEVHPLGHDRFAEPWLARLFINGLPHFTRTASASAGSHPEAMQAAYKLIADAERELMDEVHTSRASRRETAPVEVQHCRCGHNEWQHQVAGTHCGSFLPGSLKRCWCTHYQPQHVTEDPNTMEATA